MNSSSLAKVAAAGWLTVTLSGTWLMMAYANEPGTAGRALANWPEASCGARPAGRPVLVMFLHPHCPCSRASVGELAKLMAYAEGRLDARAVFLQAKGMDLEWTQTEVWQAAQEIPGVSITSDLAGAAARAFGASTSGHALLYDGAGRLLFQGGITLARGHSGENPGLDAVEALLKGGAAAGAVTPVFGCPLFDGSQGGKRCKR